MQATSLFLGNVIKIFPLEFGGFLAAAPVGVTTAIITSGLAFAFALPLVAILALALTFAPFPSGSAGRGRSGVSGSYNKEVPLS